MVQRGVEMLLPVVERERQQQPSWENRDHANHKELGSTWDQARAGDTDSLRWSLLTLETAEGGNQDKQGNL
jgi:hypothetical protein